MGTFVVRPLRAAMSNYAASSTQASTNKTSVEEHVTALTKVQALFDIPYALLTPAEVKPVLRCCLQHVYDLLSEGKLKGPEGKPCRIFASSLKAYLDRGKEPAVPPAIEDAQPAMVVTLPKPTKESKPRPANRGRSRVVLPYPR
jgi:hypothetical protein